MLDDVAGRVALLIDEVGRIEGESEAIYLNLGSFFSSLAAETDRSASVATRSLAEFRSGGSAGTGGLAELRASAGESGAFFRSLRERDAAFLGRINQSIEALSSLESLIGRVRSDSEEMEIISLNAMTVALKSGTAGKAFSVITDELKRLSTRTIALTEEITARGRALLEYFARLRDVLGELDSFQGGFFDGLDRALAAGYESLEAGTRSAAAFFRELISEARGVRGPVQGIMQEVQLQDIVRQSLQHVAISLEEARGAAGTGSGGGAEAEAEELSWVAAVAELSASLMGDVAGKLDASATAFDRDVSAVDSLVRSLGERRAVFISEASGGSAFDAAGFGSGSARYLELKKTAIGAARRLGDQVRGLEESFKGLAALLSRFQNIVVASRIEVAKNRALAGVSTTVHGMITLTERLSEDVGQAMSTTKEFIKGSTVALREYARDQSLAAEGGAEESGRDAIGATIARIEADLAALDASRAGLTQAIRGFSLYTPEFLALIEGAREELARLRSLEGRLEEARGDLESLRAAAAGRLAESGLTVAAKGAHADRLKAVIDRFTIFTHKKAAGGIGSFDVEDGADAGEVTLF